MSDLEEYETARRSILQVMNEAGLQVGDRLHELQTRADPDAWAGIAGYLKPSLLTGEQRIIDLLVALHPGATAASKCGGRNGFACNSVVWFRPMSPWWVERGPCRTFPITGVECTATHRCNQAGS